MNTGQSSGSGADGVVMSNNEQRYKPCASCKFQRKRCGPDCPMAPYFPGNRPKDFENVRKLFGVRNVMKTLSDLDVSKKMEAAQSMIFEANCRALDPSGGVYRLIASIQRDIMFLEDQRQRIVHQLLICRQMAAATPTSHIPPPTLSSLLLDSNHNSDDFFDERLLYDDNDLDLNLQMWPTSSLDDH